MRFRMCRRSNMDIIVLVALLLFFVAIKFTQSNEVEPKNHESSLLNTIFKNYDKRARPVRNYHTPVAVGFAIELQQIIQVDEKHQVITTNVMRLLRWRDEFLQWNPEEYGNVTELSLFRGQIWYPDIQLYNSASFDKEEQERYSSTRTFVASNGIVADALPIVVKSTCQMDVTWFPFDEQKCFLIYGSWTSSSKYLTLQLNDVQRASIETMDNGEWNLLGLIPNRTVKVYSCCPNDEYVRITYTIHLKRRPFYYFFNLLVPSGLIGFLAILGFTLPPESGEKLPLGATILFSLIVFLNMISESMPANSDTVPLLGAYFNCIMFTIALSVVSTIIVNVNMKAMSPKKVDGLTEKLFLHWLPRILRMNISSNIVAEQNVVLHSNEKIDDTITIQLKRSGCAETVVTYSMQADKIVAQQWSCVAVVVDRLCLVISLIVTFVSVCIFLVYAY